MKAILLALAVLLCGVANAAEGSAPQDAKAKAAIKVFNDWDEAYIKKDATPLNEILADDYVGVDDEGAVTTKADEIDLIKTGTYVLHSVKHLEPPKVRFHGNVAIINSYSEIKLTYKGETAMSVGRATTVLVDRGNGRWQVVSWHASKVKE